MIDYIVGDAKPISTVDSAYFRRLVGSLNSRFEMVGRMGMASLIANEFDSYKKELMNLVLKNNVVCLTVDSWFSRHRAFLGITIHQLDPTTMKRVSKALALKRFFGILIAINFSSTELAIKLLCTQVAPIEHEERNLLIEYLAIMELVATYLDVLQGENNICLGNVLPSVVMMKTKFSSLHCSKITILRDGL